MERHRTDIESMRMVSGFRNKEEHKTEPTGRKDRGGSVFHSSAAAKDRRHSWQMGVMLL